MLRITTTALAVLALSLPLAAGAETASTPIADSKAPEAVVVAASEDAVLLPAPRSEEQAAPAPRAKRIVKHGSSDSAAGYRFTNPYAVPQQTLPLTFPALATFSY